MLPVEARPARRFLLNRGIDAGVNAEIADDCARGLGYNDCINTANTFRYAIQLPLHEGVCEGLIRYIANKLNQFINKI